ncbi:hypothetical protein IGI04_033426 [Brassica rapa subsp. trilocularis]|uniref:Uncharacterized protein n=1 Tax=Brassica rapa subsp. trilocularis TaxID=1813537 RepID=A0ABQ7L854_BRACM|nr:hypothetical protein IGI04_033426 [Brassica rapa subsp. trilocularis]
MTFSVEDHRRVRRFEAETVRSRRCATRVDPRAQMLPRVQQPAFLMRVSSRRRSGSYGLGRGPF